MSWTAVPTARASAVCVTARKAGREQNASRGTVTHAASTTASVVRASATATRAGRASTAPSVSHADTRGAAHLHTPDRRARATEEDSFTGRIKRTTLECECQSFQCSFLSICWKVTDDACLLPTSTSAQ